MAYMNQERKKVIAAELKKVIPSAWKYSLGVSHHSTIVLNITAAPVDLLEGFRDDYSRKNRYAQVNEYYLDKNFDGKILKIMQDIKKALNAGNHDNSDVQTDYFDVGWYIDINIGKWNKPFTIVKE